MISEIGGRLIRRADKGHITMDVKKLLFQLREERDALDIAIASLERLEPLRRGPGHPRGSVTKIHADGTDRSNGPPTPAAGKPSPDGAHGPETALPMSPPFGRWKIETPRQDDGNQ